MLTNYMFPYNQHLSPEMEHFQPQKTPPSKNTERQPLFGFYHQLVLLSFELHDNGIEQCIDFNIYSFWSLLLLWDSPILLRRAEVCCFHCCVVFHCVTVPGIRFTVGGHVSFVQSVAILNKATRNIFVCYSKHFWGTRV